MMDVKNNVVSEFHGDRSYESLNKMFIRFFNENAQKSLKTFRNSDEYPGLKK